MLSTYKHPQQQQQRGNDRHYLNRSPDDIKTDGEIDDNGNFNANGNIVKDNFGSTPNLVDTIDNITTAADTLISTQLVENSLSTNDNSRSESDLTRLRDETKLVNAKSEFHLKSIASTCVVPPSSTLYVNGNNRRDTVSHGTTAFEQNTSTSPQSKMSTRGAPSSSQMTSCSISSTVSDSLQMPPRSPSIGFADTSNIRVPIIGYEVMEERARFTVVKSI